MNRALKLVSRAFVWLLCIPILFYQRCISPFTPPSCRCQTGNHKTRTDKRTLSRNPADTPLPPLGRERIRPSAVGMENGK